MQIKKTSKLRGTGLCVGNSPGPVNSPHKGPVTRKMLPFDDVIMTALVWTNIRREAQNTTTDMRHKLCEKTNQLQRNPWNTDLETLIKHCLFNVCDVIFGYVMWFLWHYWHTCSKVGMLVADGLTAGYRQTPWSCRPVVAYQNTTLQIHNRSNWANV